MTRWLARRWSDLDLQPVTHAGVPGTGTAASVAGAVGLARVLWEHPTRPDLLASTVTVVGLAVAAAGLYHLVARLGLGRGPRVLVVGVLLVNPAVLGSALAPRVAVLLASSFAALAGLVRWVGAARTPSGGELAVYVGLPLTAAVFAGYEGWALAGLAAVVVVGHQLHRRRGLVASVRRTGSLLVAPVAIGGWWVVREVLRGRTPQSVLPTPSAVLPPELALALLCLLGALPVLVVLGVVVRRERCRAAVAQPDLRLVGAPPLAPTSVSVGTGT